MFMPELLCLHIVYIKPPYMFITCSQILPYSCFGMSIHQETTILFHLHVEILRINHSACPPEA